MDQRPYWNIYGNSVSINYIQKTLQTDSIYQSYLLSGPAHTGKTTTAELFARVILCKKKFVSEPCQRCSSCTAYKYGPHPDLYLVARQEAKNAISIEQIRKAIHFITLRPSHADKKVVIIECADLLTESAANALLKTIEEPPADTVIIMSAENRDLLPATIISRCLHIQFTVSDAEEIKSLLKEHNIAASHIHPISHLSQGRPGLAVLLGKDSSIRAERERAVDLLIDMLKHRPAERVSILTKNMPQSANEKKQYALTLLQTWIAFYFDLLHMKNNSNQIINTRYEPTLRQIAEHYSNTAVVRLIQSLLASIQRVNQTANPILVIENHLLGL